MTTTSKPESPAVAEALAILAQTAGIPEIHWLPDDDACDCWFQRIGEWTNPYLGRTLRVRLCCLWGELYKQYPQFVQEIPAAYDVNRHKWVREPAEWDSEDVDMPRPIWYRHLAQQQGRPVGDIRQEYSKRRKERPKAVPKGAGRESRPQPTDAEVAAAHEARLRAGGWID